MSTLSALSKIDISSRYGRENMVQMLTESPFVRALNIFQAFESGTYEHDYRPVTQAANLQTRAKGGSYSADVLTPEAKQTVTQSIYGSEVMADDSDLRDADIDKMDLGLHLSRRYLKYYKSFAQLFDTEMVNGDGIGNNMLGLTGMIDGVLDIPGYTGIKRYIDAKSWSASVSDSFDLGLDANFTNFIEKLPEMLAKVKGKKAILCRADFIGRINSVLFAKGRLDAKDVPGFGRATHILGVPLLEMRDETLLNNEPDGNAIPVLNTQSIYILAPGEERFSFVTNSGLVLEEYDPSDPQGQGYKCEISGQLKIEDPNAVLRIANIKI